MNDDFQESMFESQSSIQKRGDSTSNGSTIAGIKVEAKFACLDNRIKDDYIYKTGGILEKHQLEYGETFNNLRNELTNYTELDDITKEFTDGKIHFIKFSNCFGSIKTSSKVSEAYMQLTPDGTKFNIFIKK